jgi:predicted transcriptional regulator
VPLRPASRQALTLRAHPQKHVFKTRRDVERYFAGQTIQCLLCGRRFRRLWKHHVAKHGMSADEYRERFGLPWTRGLTSAASAASSGWTEKRKAKARQIARRSQFFKRAHLAPRRNFAPYHKMEAIRHLGISPRTLTKSFEKRVRTLFDKGFTDRQIARVLDVGASTVSRRTKYWRHRGRTN